MTPKSNKPLKKKRKKVMGRSLLAKVGKSKLPPKLLSTHSFMQIEPLLGKEFELRASHLNRLTFFPETADLIVKKTGEIIRITHADTGKEYNLIDPAKCHNSRQMTMEVTAMQRELNHRRYYAPNEVIKAIVDPKTNKGVGIWIVSPKMLKVRPKRTHGVFLPKM